MAASGSAAAQAPSLRDIRRGSYKGEGWDSEAQQENVLRRTSSSASRRPSVASIGIPAALRRTTSSANTPAITEVPSEFTAPTSTSPDNTIQETSEKPSTQVTDSLPSTMDEKGTPMAAELGEDEPKVPWTTSFWIGLLAFLKWVFTIKGFLITIYGLNVVAWGGMLFLLLCNASPAMCTHRPDGTKDCNDINSPRWIWIEIDSQILNALFCVTGFGLVPWRFRDLWYIFVWRFAVTGSSKVKREKGLRTLAGIHRDWFRLRGSELADSPRGDVVDNNPKEVLDDPTVPLPPSKRLDPPVTGERAPPTSYWKMDFVIWMNAWNTFFQILLCFFMWHYNRRKRPSWSTGLFVAMGCIVVIIAGLMMFFEGKRVKKVEGVPPKPEQEAAVNGS